MKKNRRMKGVEVKTNQVSAKSSEKREALQKSLVIKAPVRIGMSGFASLTFELIKAHKR